MTPVPNADTPNTGCEEGVPSKEDIGFWAPADAVLVAVPNAGGAVVPDFDVRERMPDAVVVPKPPNPEVDDFVLVTLGPAEELVEKANGF